MFEKIKARYAKNYIRDDQLERYVELGAITREQADEIKKMVKFTGGGALNRGLIIVLSDGLGVWSL